MRQISTTLLNVIRLLVFWSTLQFLAAVGLSLVIFPLLLLISRLKISLFALMSSSMLYRWSFVNALIMTLLVSLLSSMTPRIARKPSSLAL